MSTLFKKYTRDDLINGTRWAVNAFKNSSLKPPANYTNLSKVQAELKRNKKFDDVNSTKVIFIEKPIEDLNLKEIQDLIKIDLKYENVKFRLTTNNTSIPMKKFGGNIKRLFNNEVNSHYHQNTINKTNLLFEKEKPFTDHEVITEQCYLMEQDSQYGRKKYVEVFKNNEFHIPITIDNVKYELCIPSLSLISRIEGIGVPSNHPNLVNIESSLKKSSLNYRLNDKQLEVYKLPPSSNTKQLTAIIPRHVLSHQKFKRTKPAVPGLVRFDGKERTHKYISSTIARELRIGAPLFFSIPYIKSVRYLNDERVTLVQDNGEVLDDSKFDKIETIVEAPNYNYDPNGTPISRVPTHVISEWLSFKKNPTWKYCNADTVRSTILTGNIISNHSFIDKWLTLQFLTNSFEYLKLQDIKAYQPVEKLSSLIKTPYDQDIIKQYYDFKSGQDDYGLGEFAVSLSNYTLYLDTANLQNNELLYNLAHRLLNDELRVYFTEFTNYYFQELKIKRSLVSYPNEPIEATNFVHIPELIAKVHSIHEFKAPYKQHLLMKSSLPTSIRENQDLIKQICEKKGIDLHMRQLEDMKLYENIYHHDETKLTLFRYTDFKPQEWRDKLQEIRFFKQFPDLTGLELENQLKRELKDDLKLIFKRMELTKEEKELEKSKLDTFIAKIMNNHFDEEFIKSCL